MAASCFLPLLPVQGTLGALNWAYVVLSTGSVLFETICSLSMASLYLLIHLFILLFNKYLYITCHVPGPVPNARVKTVNRMDNLVDKDK